MQRFIQHALIPVVMIFSGTAWADFEEGKNAILVNFAFAKGGASLGADFEHGIHRTFGVGGYLRIHPEEEDPNDPGVMAFGGFIRPHFNRQNWDFSVAPGFGIAQIDFGNDDETMIGPALALNLLYEFSTTMAAGVEHAQFYGWFGEDEWIGGVLEEFYAKFRFMF